MFRQEERYARHQMEACECNARGDAQMAREAVSFATRGIIGLADLLDRSLRVMVELPTCRGERKAARRAHEQAHAEPLLQCRDRLGNCGLADAHLPCRRGKGRSLDRANERFHCCQVIHVSIRISCCPRRQGPRRLRET